MFHVTSQNIWAYVSQFAIWQHIWGGVTLCGIIFNHYWLFYWYTMFTIITMIFFTLITACSQWLCDLSTTSSPCSLRILYSPKRKRKWRLERRPRWIQPTLLGILVRSTARRRLTSSSRNLTTLEYRWGASTSVGLLFCDTDPVMSNN